MKPELDTLIRLCYTERFKIEHLGQEYWLKPHKVWRDEEHPFCVKAKFELNGKRIEWRVACYEKKRVWYSDTHNWQSKKDLYTYVLREIKWYIFNSLGSIVSISMKVCNELDSKRCKSLVRYLFQELLSKGMVKKWGKKYYLIQKGSTLWKKLCSSPAREILREYNLD